MHGFGLVEKQGCLQPCHSIPLTIQSQNVSYRPLDFLANFSDLELNISSAQSWSLCLLYIMVMGRKLDCPKEGLAVLRGQVVVMGYKVNVISVYWGLERYAARR